MIEQHLTNARNADAALYFEGPPGIGKTARIEAWAETNNLLCHTIIGSTLDPTDLGVPLNSDGKLEWVLPYWAHELAEKGGVLFLDELTSVPPAVLAAMQRIILEKRLHHKNLKDTFIVAAGNPAEYATSGAELPPAVIGRLHIVQLTPQGLLDDWLLWMLQKGAAHAKVAAFLKSRQDLACDTRNMSKPFPSFRSWDRAANFLKNNVTDIAGSVGSGAATEFLAWAKTLDLPTPEELFSGAKKLPSRLDSMFAAIGSCVAFASGHNFSIEIQQGYHKVFGNTPADLRIISAEALLKAVRSTGKPLDIPGLIASGIVSNADEVQKLLAQ